MNKSTKKLGETWLKDDKLSDDFDKMTLKKNQKKQKKRQIVVFSSSEEEENDPFFPVDPLVRVTQIKPKKKSPKREAIILAPDTPEMQRIDRACGSPLRISDSDED